jgi:hypothetical protein
MQGVLYESWEFKLPPLLCMFLVTYLHDAGHFSHILRDNYSQLLAPNG